MFFAGGTNSFAPLELSGIGGRPEVARLQASLRRLAHLAQRPSADPGPESGVLGEKTMISVGGTMDLLTQQLPHWVVEHLHNAMMLGASSTEAKNVVGRYVTELRVAADQASQYFAHVPGPSDFPQPPHLSVSLGGFFDPGWYTDLPKLMLVSGVILLGIWFIAHKR